MVAKKLETILINISITLTILYIQPISVFEAKKRLAN